MNPPPAPPRPPEFASPRPQPQPAPEGAGTHAATDDAFIAYLEQHTQATWAAANQIYDRHFDRASRIGAMLTGGAGAIASWLFGRWHTVSTPEGAALLTLVIGWAGCAAHLVFRGMQGSALPIGADANEIANGYRHYGGDYRAPQPAATKAAALQAMRLDQIKRLREDIHLLTQANSRRSRILSRTMAAAVATPLVALAVLATITSPIGALMVAAAAAHLD